MASEDVFRPYVEWYVTTLTNVIQGLCDNDNVSNVIREAIDVLDDVEARNALGLIITHQAQQAIKQGKRKWRPLE